MVAWSVWNTAFGAYSLFLLVYSMIPFAEDVGWKLRRSSNRDPSLCKHFTSSTKSHSSTLCWATIGYVCSRKSAWIRLEIAGGIEMEQHQRDLDELVGSLVEGARQRWEAGGSENSCLVSAYLSEVGKKSSCSVDRAQLADATTR